MPAPGKKPTKPLCYGGWMPVGLDDAYGRKYAELYAALGFRSLHPALTGPDVLKNLAAVGVPPTKSWDVGAYRNPPTPANIAAAKKDLVRTQMQPYLRSFDYGDEIDFSEWVGMMAQEEIAKAAAEGRKVTKEDVLSHCWRDWLKANRPDGKAIDYWPEKWGAFDAAKMRPGQRRRGRGHEPQAVRRFAAVLRRHRHPFRRRRGQTGASGLRRRRADGVQLLQSPVLLSQ